MKHEHHVKDDRGWWACFRHEWSPELTRYIGFRWIYDHEPNKITRWRKHGSDDN